MNSVFDEYHAAPFLYPKMVCTDWKKCTAFSQNLLPSSTYYKPLLHLLYFCVYDTVAISTYVEPRKIWNVLFFTLNKDKRTFAILRMGKNDNTMLYLDRNRILIISYLFIDYTNLNIDLIPSSNQR